MANTEPHRPPGHTPRAWGNTHDDNQDKTGYQNAGPTYRYAQEGCYLTITSPESWVLGQFKPLRRSERPK